MRVLALTLVLLCTAAPAAHATDWMQLRVLNIAHQGGEDEVPSNTMYAYERSLRIGADMLEVDIHTSADGELVVLHDATVDRTTDGSGRVYDMTLEEIQKLDAGHNMVPGEGTEADRPAADYPFRGVRLGERKPPPGFAPDDFRIPTLDEVMRAYPSVPINIEIKGAADSDVGSFMRNAEALATYLNELGRVDGIMVASFNDAALARFHELAPQIDMAPALAAAGAYKFGSVPPPEGVRAFQVPLAFSGVTVVDEEFIDRAHRDGYGVHVWTINDPAEMRQLLDWDADGIMTAEPIVLEQVLCERGIALGGCRKRASIACTVAPVKRTKRAVVLARRDKFDGRCAGTVRAAGRKKHFAFAEDARRVRVALRTKNARTLRIEPYTAFVTRARLPRSPA